MMLNFFFVLHCMRAACAAEGAFSRAGTLARGAADGPAGP
jgi:hypothetical protein